MNGILTWVGFVYIILMIFELIGMIKGISCGEMLVEMVWRRM